ncbi:MAG: DUF1449 family protein [Moraxellaceae bacterium]|nr:MAG: DUF1449 family protein [Moraxellaceae bacterium]
MSLFVATQTLPFGVALLVMLGLTVLEVIGLITALSPSSWIDSLLPEPAVDGGLDGVLGWLHVGKVPSLILLILFLASFSVAGYAVQIFARNLLGFYLPAFIAFIPAFFGAMASVRLGGKWLAYIVPRDESSAISESEFVGRVALVTAVSSQKILAAQARLRDTDGRSYFILVEPDLEDLQLTQGMQVLLIKKMGSVYRVIENPHPTLI